MYFYFDTLSLSVTHCLPSCLLFILYISDLQCVHMYSICPCHCRLLLWYFCLHKSQWLTQRIPISLMLRQYLWESLTACRSDRNESDHTSSTQQRQKHDVNKEIQRMQSQPYISVSIPENFVQQVAELPADHGVAGQRQVQDVGPEGGGSTLLMCTHDDVCTAVKQTSAYWCTRWWKWSIKQQVGEVFVQPAASHTCCLQN